MIEILFGESETGAMKAAQQKEEIICLNFLLDIGNIKEEIDSQYRKKLIYSMYAQEQWGKEIDTELKQLGDIYCHEMKRLLEFLNAKMPVRIWYSNAPYSMCGFYHLCSILQNYNSEIRVVKLPEHQVCPGGIVCPQNWGEIAPEKFTDFLSYECKLTPEEVRLYAFLWNDLKADNSPLRALINGRIIGVPEDFYDFLIWKILSGNPTKEARLIGDILGQNQISVGNWWYANRINFFIEQGRIKVLKDSENKYARTICLA